MTPVVRRALLLTAVALLIVALAGPVQRAMQARARAVAAQALAEKVAQERASLAAELGARRAEIVADLRARLQAGEYAAVMQGAGRYLALGDAELREIHRKAAVEVSAQVAVNSYRKLIQSDCTDAQVRYQLAHLLDYERVNGKTPPPIEYEGLTLVRLNGADASKAALTRMQAPHPKEGPVPPGADWITRVRANNLAHPLRDFTTGLMSASAQELLCVWRVEASRRDGDRAVRFSMVLWLAPAPDGKTLQADPVVYSEQPA